MTTKTEVNVDDQATLELRNMVSEVQRGILDIKPIADASGEHGAGSAGDATATVIAMLNLVFQRACEEFSQIDLREEISASRLSRRWIRCYEHHYQEMIRSEAYSQAFGEAISLVYGCREESEPSVGE